MICFPNIKINLGLRVINRRTDGFHTIESVFYPVSFCDMLEMVVDKEVLPGTVHFESTGLTIAGNADDNLICKAYQLLHSKYNLPGIHIHLHKQIPMGAGLGGGSSDAAYMIKLLNTKFELGLTIPAMEEYAAQLGSDCAFFIENKPAYLLGKGPELEPYSIDLGGYHIVLIDAQVHSSTALAYQNVRRRETVEQSLRDLLQQPIESWKQTIENDFEVSVFGEYPQLKTVKEQLYSSGAFYASMSGSGAVMYGLFKQKPQLDEKLRPLVCFEGLL
jgi:4-diphosphocytidyl-2-C-methyl-D-erythritol kinase